MSVDFLKKLGVFLDEDFLSPSACDDLRDQMLASVTTVANVYSADEGESRFSEEIRQSKFAAVDSDTHASITNKIVVLKPKLEAHFGETYDSEIEVPKYLIYNEGDFFAAHKDDQLGRKINITIYLNDEVDVDQVSAGEYADGTLKLYGLINKPGLYNWGVSLRGQKGLLIAYPAEIVHEVTAITRGQRLAVVARFLDPSR